MATVLLLNACLVALELGLWLAGLATKKVVAFSMALLLLLTAAWLVLISPTVLGIVYGFVAIYRAVNFWRIRKARRQPDHLYSVARRASLGLIGASALLLGALHGLEFGFMHREWLGYAALANCIVCAALLYSTQRQLRTTQPPKYHEAVSEQDLPTLTVAIPARNETDDLTACLETLIKSTYRKLEILVLDDCSQNKRTPEIIRAFAQDGVRFIAGKQAPDAWLAKNYGYQQLLEAASGDLLLFCGVDTRFKPETLTLLVSDLLLKKKSMISLLPANAVPEPWEFESLLVQPSRYAWELVPLRRFWHRPPVLSTAWLITRDALQDAGGLGAVSHAITPERYFARYTARHDDGYSFMQSTSEQGISSAKSFNEQRATAIRIRYPQLHQRLELAALVSGLEFAMLVGPYVLLLIGLARTDPVLTGLSAISCVFLTLIYSQVMTLTYRRFLLRSLWLFPFAVLYDVALLNYSLYRYEFGDIDWKGRNICIPVMQVIPRLPQP